MPKKRVGLMLAISGFSLEQVALGLGILALIAVQDKSVGVMLTITAGALVLVSLPTIVMGAMLWHRGNSNG